MGGRPLNYQSLAKILEEILDGGNKMMYHCHNCDATFTEMEQTDFQHKHGQCPYCHSDDVTEIDIDKEEDPCQQ